MTLEHLQCAVLEEEKEYVFFKFECLLGKQYAVKAQAHFTVHWLVACLVVLILLLLLLPFLF